MHIRIASTNCRLDDNLDDRLNPMSPTETRKLAHRLIDHMAPGQVAAVVGLLEAMIDPVTRSLANALFDDEPVTEEDLRDIAESREWLKHNKAIPKEEVLADFGLTSEDFERMGRTPLDSLGSNP